MQKVNYKKILLGWCIWFCGLFGFFGFDYLLRLRDHNIKTGGFPDAAGALLIILLGMYSLYVVFQGIKNLKPVWLWPLLILQATTGYAAAGFIGLYYVCSAGIDCL